VVSVWKHASGTYGLLYFNGLEVFDWVVSNFAVSSHDRNRLMHALNGNIADDNYFKPLDELDGSDVVSVAAALVGASNAGQVILLLEAYGPADGPLSCGPKYVGVSFFKKSDKKRSPSGAAHSGARGRAKGPPPDATPEQIAHWCLATRPSVDLVPDVDHRVVRAYRDRIERSEVFPSSCHNVEIFNCMHFRTGLEEIDGAVDVVASRGWGFKPSEVPTQFALMDRRERNRLMHSLNGNTLPPGLDWPHAYVEALEQLSADDLCFDVDAVAAQCLGDAYAQSVILRSDVDRAAAGGYTLPAIFPEVDAGSPFLLPQGSFYITAGFLNGRQDGDLAYKHVMTATGLMVQSYDGDGWARMVREPSDIIKANGLRLLRKFVTRVDGKVHPEMATLYLFGPGPGVRGELPKRRVSAADGARLYEAVIGPHVCTLFVRNGGVWDEAVVSRETYLNISRNYMSGSSLSVVRRSTMSMFRQGRDPDVTASDLTVWSDYCAYTLAPETAASLMAHSSARSQLLTDAATGYLRWRWWGFWDPYAVGVDWYQVAHGSPMPWHARLVVGGALTYFVTTRAYTLSCAFTTGFDRHLRAFGGEVASASTSGVETMAASLRRVGSFVGMHAARLYLRFNPPPPEPISARIIAGARAAARDFWREFGPVSRCDAALVASPVERVLPIWPLFGLAAIGACYMFRRVVSERRPWRPNFFSDPMGRYAQFWKRLPVAMHHTARILRWSKLDNVDGNQVYQSLPTVGHAFFSSFAKGPQNALHSFVARVARPTPEPTAAAIDRYAYAWGMMTSRCDHVEPTPWEEFVARFPPGKRRLYNDAKELLDVWGVRLFDPKAFGGKNRLFNRQCFLKHELNFTYVDQEHGIAGKDPRTIMTMHDTLQALFGPWFHAYGSMLQRGLGGGDGQDGWRLRFAYGMTKSELFHVALTEHLDCPIYIVICGDDAFFRRYGILWFVDGTRWDAHMKMHMLEPKFRHYQQLGMPPVMVNILRRLTRRRVVYNKGYQQIVGTIEGTVSSGDPDTLPGNCGKMAAALISVLGCEDWEAAAQALGLAFEVAAKQGVIYDPHGDFCSCVVAGDTFILKPGKVMGKLPFVSNPGYPPALIAAAKLQAAVYDLKPFPEICAIITTLNTIYPWDSLPSYVVDAVGGRYRMLSEAVGHVESPSAFFAERYGVSYQSLVDELRLWAHAALSGEHEVDMPSWSVVVATDLGKEIDVGGLPWGSALFKRLDAAPRAGVG